MDIPGESFRVIGPLIPAGSVFMEGPSPLMKSAEDIPSCSYSVSIELGETSWTPELVALVEGGT